MTPVGRFQKWLKIVAFGVVIKKGDIHSHRNTKTYMARQVYEFQGVKVQRSRDRPFRLIVVDSQRIDHPKRNVIYTMDDQCILGTDIRFQEQQLAYMEMNPMNRQFQTCSPKEWHERHERIQSEHRNPISRFRPSYDVQDIVTNDSERWSSHGVDDESESEASIVSFCSDNQDEQRECEDTGINRIIHDDSISQHGQGIQREVKTNETPTTKRVRKARTDEQKETRKRRDQEKRHRESADKRYKRSGIDVSTGVETHTRDEAQTSTASFHCDDEEPNELEDIAQNRIEPQKEPRKTIPRTEVQKKARRGRTEEQKQARRGRTAEQQQARRGRTEEQKQARKARSGIQTAARRVMRMPLTPEQNHSRRESRISRTPEEIEQRPPRSPQQIEQRPPRTAEQIEQRRSK